MELYPHTCDLKHPCQWTRPWSLMEQVSQKKLQAHQSRRKTQLKDYKQSTCPKTKNPSWVSRVLPGSAELEHQRRVKWVGKNEVHELRSQKISPWWLWQKGHHTDVAEQKQQWEWELEIAAESEPFFEVLIGVAISSHTYLIGGNKGFLCTCFVDSRANITFDSWKGRTQAPTNLRDDN